MAFIFLQPLAVAPDSAGNLGLWHLASFMENSETSQQKPYDPTEAVV